MEDKDQSNDVTRTASKTVHQRFEEVIQALGLTRNKFAGRLGMASTQIYSVINGRNAPSHKMYEAIANRFPEVNLSYLIAEKGYPLKPTVEEQQVKSSKVKNLEKELAEIKTQLENREEATRDLIAKEVGRLMQMGLTAAKQKNNVDGNGIKKKKIKSKR